MSSEITKYRDWLIQADHEACRTYDKAVMTLSGGALGISITFLHDVIPSPIPETKCFLAVSWVSLTLSLALILISFLTSMKSLRKTIKQVDDGTIYKVYPGGFATHLTVVLRILAALGFIAGVMFFLVFALKNF